MRIIQSMPQPLNRREENWKELCLEIERERNALADALRVRMLGICKDCGYLLDIEKHIETCSHYETEKKLIQQG